MDKNIEEMILERLTSLERSIEENNILQKEILTIDELAIYISTSLPNLYLLTSKNEIPFYKPNGKKVYFKRSEIDDWVFNTRHNCKRDIQKRADKFQSNFKK